MPKKIKVSRGDQSILFLTLVDRMKYDAIISDGIANPYNYVKDNAQKILEKYEDDYPVYERILSDAEVKEYMELCVPNYNHPNKKIRQARLSQKEALSKKVNDIYLKLGILSVTNNPADREHLPRRYQKLMDFDITPKAIAKNLERANALMSKNPQEKRDALTAFFKRLGNIDLSRWDLNDPQFVIDNINEIMTVMLIGPEFEPICQDAKNLGVDFRDPDLRSFCLKIEAIMDYGTAARLQVERMCSNGYEFFGTDDPLSFEELLNKADDNVPGYQHTYEQFLGADLGTPLYKDLAFSAYFRNAFSIGRLCSNIFDKSLTPKQRYENIVKTKPDIKVFKEIQNYHYDKVDEFLSMEPKRLQAIEELGLDQEQLESFARANNMSVYEYTLMLAKSLDPATADEARGLHMPRLVKSCFVPSRVPGNMVKNIDPYYTREEPKSINKIIGSIGQKALDENKDKSAYIAENIEKLYEQYRCDNVLYKKEYNDQQITDLMKSIYPGFKLPEMSVRKERLKIKAKTRQKLHESYLKQRLIYEACENPDWDKTQLRLYERLGAYINDGDMSPAGIARNKAKYDKLFSKDKSRRKEGLTEFCKEIGQMDIGLFDINDPVFLAENTDIVLRVAIIGAEMQILIQNAIDNGIDFSQPELKDFCLKANAIYEIGMAALYQYDKVCSNAYEYFGLDSMGSFDKVKGSDTVPGKNTCYDEYVTEDLFSDDFSMVSYLTQKIKYPESYPVLADYNLSPMKKYANYVTAEPASRVIKESIYSKTTAEEREAFLKKEAEQAAVLEEMGLTRAEVAELAEAKGITVTEYLAMAVSENKTAEREAEPKNPDNSSEERQFETIADVEKFYFEVAGRLQREHLDDMVKALRTLNKISKDNPDNPFRCYKAGELLDRAVKSIGQIIKDNPDLQGKEILTYEDSRQSKDTMDRHTIAVSRLKGETSIQKEASLAAITAIAAPQNAGPVN